LALLGGPRAFGLRVDESPRQPQPFVDALDVVRLVDDDPEEALVSPRTGNSIDGSILVVNNASKVWPVV
jgi:hypothetical protein